jgi:hypothetical protein
MEQENIRLEAENAYLLDEIRSERSVGDMIGGSAGLRRVMQQINLNFPDENFRNSPM